jgi:hypothetical protein
VQDGVVTLVGRQKRFLNVNRVNPLDFARAEFRLRPVSAAETGLSLRLDFSGYWRAVAIIGLFTFWGGLCLVLPGGNRVSALRVMVIVVAFGIFFLAVRYVAQANLTRAYFTRLTRLVLERVQAGSRLPKVG